MIQDFERMNNVFNCDKTQRFFSFKTYFKPPTEHITINSLSASYSRAGREGALVPSCQWARCTLDSRHVSLSLEHTKKQTFTLTFITMVRCVRGR